MLEYITIFIMSAWLVFLWLLVLARREDNGDEPAELPPVSVLIAVRNEEAHIKNLCRCLAQLDYPASKLEILIGNDASTDQTLQLLEAYKPDHATIINFPEKETGQFGKQKVIAALAKQAKGEYLLFTDGDMQMSPGWIRGLLRKSKGGRALVVGITAVHTEGFFSRMQYMDWVFNEKIVSWFANIGIGLTAWGNNMMISRKLYDAVGGFENQPDSIVEDVALLRAVQQAGGVLAVANNQYALAFTAPIKTLKLLLYQRKRWIRGMNRYRALVLFGTCVKLLLWPSVGYLAYVSSYWLLVIFAVLMAKGIVHQRLTKLTEKPISILDLLLFEVYEFVFYLITFAFCFLPGSIDWKGRKY